MDVIMFGVNFERLIFYHIKERNETFCVRRRTILFFGEVFFEDKSGKITLLGVISSRLRTAKLAAKQRPEDFNLSFVLN